MSDEKLTELGALAAQAEGMEAAEAAEAAAAQGEAPEAAPSVSNAQLLAGTFQLARDTFCIVGELQSPRLVLTDDACNQLGAAWGAVADKRGWDLVGVLGDYAAEFSAVMLSVTLGMKLRRGVGDELAVKAEREAEKQRAAESETVVNV